VHLLWGLNGRAGVLAIVCNLRVLSSSMRKGYGGCRFSMVFSVEFIGLISIMGC
jgi:hypothetical protein